MLIVNLGQKAETCTFPGFFLEWIFSWGQGCGFHAAALHWSLATSWWRKVSQGCFWCFLGTLSGSFAVLMMPLKLLSLFITYHDHPILLWPSWWWKECDELGKGSNKKVVSFDALWSKLWLEWSKTILLNQSYANTVMMREVSQRRKVEVHADAYNSSEFTLFTILSFFRSLT